MRLLVLVLVALLALLPAGARAAELPWQTLTQADADVVNVEVAACAAGPVVIARLETEKDAYLMLLAPDSGRAFIGVWKGNIPGAIFDEVGIGPYHVGDLGGQLRWEPFSVERHADPCPFLYPERA